MKLHWGNAIVIFFTIFVSLSIFFIVFSLRQDNDLVDDDYYEKGANYSSHMKIQQRSGVYSDSVKVTEFKANVLVNLPSSIYGFTDALHVYFYNSSSKEKDYNILLSNLSDSVYIDKNNIYPGRYVLKLEWELADGKYLVEKDISIY